MEKFLFPALAVIILASCAAPKYSYHFDTYDYNSGRKTASVVAQEDSPLTINHESVSASAVVEPAVDAGASRIRVKPTEVSVSEAREELAKKYSEMSKSERRQFRKEVKEQIKSYSQSIKDGDGVKAAAEMTAMDNDLKLAIIFGAVGLTLSLFGGINEAFWILGVISIVVGVVFLVKWLVRQ